MRPLKKLSGVIIATPFFDESIKYYTDGFGLELATSDDLIARFDGAHGEKSVLIIHKAPKAALVGLTMAMDTSEELVLAREALNASGITTENLDFPNQSDAFSVESPDGHTVGFVADPHIPDPSPSSESLPLFVSHLVINTKDTSALLDFFVSTLGFTIADMYEKNFLTFLRCDQPQHHCIGVAPGDAGSLNHFSMDVGSIDALMTSIGRMQRAGFSPVWGPGRHGPGGNVFCYFEDPSGFVAEFTCDVIQIKDEESWVAKEWPRVPEIANVWGTGGPSERAVHLMGGNN